MKRWLTIGLLLYGVYLTNSASEEHLRISSANAQDVALFHVLQGSTNNMENVTFSPDGSTLAVIEVNYPEYIDGTIRLWDIPSFEEKEFPFLDTLEVMSIAFNSDGTIIAGGDHSGSIYVADLTDMTVDTLALATETDLGRINDLAFSFDNQFLAVAQGNLSGAAGEYAFKLFEMDTGRKRFDFLRCGETCPGSGLSVTFNPSGSIVAFATTRQGLVRLWDTGTGDEIAALEKHVIWAFDVIFTPDGRSLIYVATDGIRVWDMEAINKQQIKFRVFAQPEKDEAIYSIALNPDGDVLAAGYIDGTIRLWDLPTGNLLNILEGHVQHERDDLQERFDGHEGRVISLDFNPDGTLLASGGIDGTVRVWGIPAEK